MAEYYSNPQDVIEFTGIKPKKLQINDDTDVSAEEKLEDTLENWLIQIKDIIDRYTGEDYSEDTPGVIENAALRMAGNMVTLAMVRRNTSLMQSDNFDMAIIKDNILTESIKEDLESTIDKENEIKAVGDY